MSKNAPGPMFELERSAVCLFLELPVEVATANGRLVEEVRKAYVAMLDALKSEVCSAGCQETCCGRMRAAIKLADDSIVPPAAPVTDTATSVVAARKSEEKSLARERGDTQ